MEFMLGCNYWASVTGTDMWRDWRPEIIENDLKILSEHGVKYLRVFPLWRDFQPVKKLYAWRNTFGEYANVSDEKPLGNNVLGIDPVQIEHFKTFAKMADQNGQKLIVSIVTGWMSGRMFVPLAIEGKNLITDPEVHMWTSRFIKGIVSSFKDIENIVMWDLGNECNCLSEAPDRYSAYAWTSMAKNCILAEDSTRPISSGMHGLGAETDAIWTIADQGELCNYLSTHPYPSPTVGGDAEPYNRLKTTMISTAQSEFYSGLSGRPCQIQEQGTFTESLGNREMAAKFLRVNVLSAVANGIEGYLWWCGMEHRDLMSAPYRWSMIERELGLFDAENMPKPVAKMMQKMNGIVYSLPRLKSKKYDTVCVLGRMEDKWPVAFASYTLGKQAGLEVTFRNCETSIPEADIYLLPAIWRWQITYRETYDELLEHVKSRGADLYVSFDGGQMTCFEKFFGLRSHGFLNSNALHTFHLKDKVFNYNVQKEILLESVGAEILAENEEGNPVFTKFQYGKGNVYFLSFPLERMMWPKADAFDVDKAEPYYRIYQQLGEKALKKKLIRSTNPHVTATVRETEEGEYIVFAINYSDRTQPFTYELNSDWKLEPIYGQSNIEACDGYIAKLVRER